MKLGKWPLEINESQKLILDSLSVTSNFMGREADHSPPSSAEVKE